MRHRGASIFIYLIFGLLILIFVINFAPQGGRGGGCSTGSNTIVEVDGSKASKAAYHVAYSNPYNQGRNRDRVYRALELIIRRELLADAADARGIRVTRDLLDEEIKKGFFFIGGYRVPLDEQIFDKHEDGSKIWNLGKFKRWVQMLDVSQNSYLDEQMRSYQAALMSELLSSSARVSRDEALQDYLFEHNTVTYDVVAFEPSAYRAAMRLTDADIARFLADHEQDVQAKYKADERTYKGVKPQLKLREIFIAKAEPAAAPPPAEPGKPAPAAAKPEPAAKPVGLPIEEAKSKLEAARTAIEAKKQTFADAAKQLNTDEALKANGGELGWRSVENAQLGDKAVNDAVKALKPGEMTPVITTDRGAYVVLAEDKREGDLSYDQVKNELAAELARDVWSKEAAKRDALKALDEARAGTGKNLDQMFERAAEAPSGGSDIMQLLNDPSIPEETKRQIIEQIQRQQAGGQHGSIEIESRDIPASWKAADETAGAGATAPAAGSAAPAAGGADPAAATATATTTAAPAPAAELTASKDQLPSFGPVEKAKVRKHGPTPRMTTLPGVGKEVVPVLFDELTAGMLGKRVYEAEGNYVLVQVVEKSQAKVEDFDKTADQQIAQLQAARGRAAVDEWLKARCIQLASDKKIKANADLVRETDDQGKPLPQVYRPCMSFR